MTNINKNKKELKNIYYLHIFTKSIDSVTKYQLFQPTFYLIHEQRHQQHSITLHSRKKSQQQNGTHLQKKFSVFESL